MQRLLIATLCLVLPFAAHAGRSWEDIDVRAEKAGEGVYMLHGAGGNIGAVIGEDGIFLIDDQFAPLTQKIRTALDELPGGRGKPVKFVLNTHVHGDHTGGNENLGKSGALVVAHENVRRRMTTDEFRKSFLEAGGANVEDALPVVTFSDRMTFHLDNHELATRHYPHAHTDGDSVVWFKDANIVHMGDIYFASGYPFIDVDRGGSVSGVIDAVNDVLARADGRTVIIPGHGPLADRDGLQSYRDMLVAIRARVAAAIEDGRSLEEIQAMKLSAPWDERWSWQFIDGERFIESVYRSLAATREAHRHE